MFNIEAQYKKEGAYSLVEMKLSEIRQLFNSFDPAPFREKDLDAHAETYILDSVRELPLSTPVKLVIHLPAGSCTNEMIEAVPAAVQTYFTYRAEITAKSLRAMLQQGRTALIIGVLFLFTCLAAQQLLSSLHKSGLFWSILEEGFLISGWVAMWRPMDVFLYEWWPIRRSLKVYRKLSKLLVDIRPYP